MIIIPDKLRRPAEVERDELRKHLAEAWAEIENLKWHINSEKAKAEAALALNDRALGLVNKARAEIERLSKRDGNAKHELVYDDGDNPFAREKLEHVDFGVADNNYVLESHLLNNILEQIKAKDKLIEQMRKALNLMLEGAIHDFHYVCQHCDNCLCWCCQKVRVKAALSAAERGE
jgi:predicted RNase H-like HicB family nuclease